MSQILDAQSEDEAREAAERALVDGLIDELERLPAEPSVALRVVWVADDPTSSARDLAGAVTADPGLTARLLRLANSAYYGLSGRVANVQFAVTVVGFPTVRAMSAATAGGLFKPGERVTPEGFWEHAVQVATACSILAPRAGLAVHDAFSLGLLHDLGSALLYRSDPDRFEAIVAEARQESTPLGELERRDFGMDHAEAAARVFAAWRFPDDLVDAVRRHHAATDATAPPQARLLAAAESIASRLSNAPLHELTVTRDAGLVALGLTSLDSTVIGKQVQADAAELMIAFSS